MIAVITPSKFKEFKCLDKETVIDSISMLGETRKSLHLLKHFDGMTVKNPHDIHVIDDSSKKKKILKTSDRKLAHNLKIRHMTDVEIEEVINIFNYKKHFNSFKKNIRLKIH